MDELLQFEAIDTIDPVEVFDIQDPDYRAQLRFLCKIVLASMSNERTRRAYEIHLRRFVAQRLPLSRAGVTLYLAGPKLTPSTRCIAMAAFRKLVAEAEAARFLSPFEARAIEKIKTPRVPKVRLGHWLTLTGVRSLMLLPNRSTLEGSRDAAMLALLIGCGLRRMEASALIWDHYRLVNERMVLRDIKGKGNQLRTVPVPEWARIEIDHWHEALILRFGGDAETVDNGPLLRAIPLFKLPWDALTPAGIFFRVQAYAKALDMEFTPHDLRRTLAQLMRKAGVQVEQIQMTLGHSSIKTTERYLGGALVLEAGEAGVDKIDW